MTHETETQPPEPERTPTAYQRDLHRARLVIGQLREDALDSWEPFHVGNLVLDAAALDELWDGLDRMDTHFWKEASFRQYMESRAGTALCGGASKIEGEQPFQDFGVGEARGPAVGVGDGSIQFFVG